MATPIDWTSGDHGVITSDGTKIPYNQLQQTDPLLYKQYVEGIGQPGASLQSTQLSNAANTVNVQQTQAPQALSADLKKGMTLSDAMSKYKALKMSANDIFQQYLSENTYGEGGKPKLPVENLTQLQGMGVNSDALGKIGDIGSFTDKYNAKNAVDELRLARNYFKQTQAADVAGNIAGVNTSSKAYENARTIAGLHLSSLIPGASGAQATGNTLLDLLPSSKDLRSYTPEMVDSAFNSVEKTLLASRGYDYKSLNLNDPTNTSSNNTPKKGGDLLNTLLENSGKDAKNIAETYSAANPDLISMLTNPKTRESYQNWVQTNGNPINQVLGIGKQYADLVTNPVKSFTEHPVNTALAVLGPLLGLKGGASEGAAAEGAATEGAAAEGAGVASATADAFKGAPGKLSQIFTPGKAKNVIGNIRDNLISNADKNPDSVVSGDTLAKNIRAWADKAKLSNLPDANAIEEAALNAEKQYVGKTFKPSDLKGIYDNIEGGYTKGSVPKSSTASYIDRGVQGLIADQLEKVAPGFQKTSDLFRQTFQAEKSPVKKYAKIGAGLGLGAMGGNAIIDTVKKLLMAL